MDRQSVSSCKKVHIYEPSVNIFPCWSLITSTPAPPLTAPRMYGRAGGRAGGRTGGRADGTDRLPERADGTDGRDGQAGRDGRDRGVTE